MKAAAAREHAGPRWGVTTDVKLTPATERHVHFPASMHDVPPEARRKNEARVGARKPEGYASEEGDAHREERTREA